MKKRVDTVGAQIRAANLALDRAWTRGALRGAAELTLVAASAAPCHRWRLIPAWLEAAQQSSDLGGYRGLELGMQHVCEAVFAVAELAEPSLAEVHAGESALQTFLDQIDSWEPNAASRSRAIGALLLAAWMNPEACRATGGEGRWHWAWPHPSRPLPYMMIQGAWEQGPGHWCVQAEAVGPTWDMVRALVSRAVRPLQGSHSLGRLTVHCYPLAVDPDPVLLPCSEHNPTPRAIQSLDLRLELDAAPWSQS